MWVYITENFRRHNFQVSDTHVWLQCYQGIQLTVPLLGVINKLFLLTVSVGYFANHAERQIINNFANHAERQIINNFD